jgi:hydrogenase nickel incorporation protein HypA/HybF
MEKGLTDVHELALTESVVASVAQRLPGATIRCVHLDIGALSGVAADSVRFCFDLATHGTRLEGAMLEITHIPGRCRCRSCGAEFEPEDLLLLCCCGSADVAVISGQEFTIASVQVA